MFIIFQRVTFKLAGLVYRSLHESSPTYLSSVLPLTLQHDLFDLRLTFLLNPISELHLFLVASDQLLPLSPHSDPDSKLISLLQLVNNWPPSELSAPLIRRQTRFCGRYKCFYITLHITSHCVPFK